MIKRYILIDDETGSESPAELYGEELEAASKGRLEIKAYRPRSMSVTLQSVAEARPDGLLLDVALTNARSDDGSPIGFDGVALAQQIRTLQTRTTSLAGGGFPEFPLIRLSKRDVVREYISGDTTSDDLFDDRIDKDEILSDAGSAARRAYSLAVDYPRLSDLLSTGVTDEALSQLLGISVDYLGRLDVRAVLGLRRPEAPAHVLARYVVATLLGRPGALVSEELLAVRLGVDIAASKDWHALLACLDGAAYRGVFADGYPRWWMALVLDWWQEHVDDEVPPFRITAPDRVGAVRNRIGISDLTPLSDDLDSPGLKFWHRCIKSGRPVDPSLGFALMPIWGQETWQDSDYLSLEEALRDRQNPRLSAPERNRLTTLLESRKNK